jgi:hypothetical protein
MITLEVTFLFRVLREAPEESLTLTRKISYKMVEGLLAENTPVELLFNNRLFHGFSTLNTLLSPTDD